MEGLHVHGVHHAYDGVEVLDNVSLTVPAGELVCLLGPSGCGKTTLLRLAAGLETLQEGQITIAEKVVAEPGRQLAPEHRRVGYMFQDYALFPHLTILDNVTFGLFRRPRPEARQRALDMLDQVGMRDQAEKHPHMLSGGQQQRVALARVLAPEPRLVLLDEPFSGLDTNMRARIREETLSVLRQSGVATLMVTHDPEEAMFMADRIKVMGSRGRVLQSGRPADIYYKPVDEYVARLFGHMNHIEGVVCDGGIASSFGPIAGTGMAEGQRVRVLIRPEGLMLSNGGGDKEGTPVEIVSSHLLGNSSMVRCRFSEGENRGSEFLVRVAGTFDAAEKGPIRARIDPRHVFLYGRA
jgi:iron(III) transport system ATP-binding protein